MKKSGTKVAEKAGTKVGASAVKPPATEAPHGKVEAPQVKAEGHRGPSALDLAFEALKEAGKPLNQNELTTVVLAKGWKTSGKTPGATIYASITLEIKRKGDESRFARADGVRGAFIAVQKAA